MKCHKCGRSARNNNICLTRINEAGIEGVWECTPSCKTVFLRPEDAVNHALSTITNDNKAHEIQTTEKAWTDFRSTALSGLDDKSVNELKKVFFAGSYAMLNRMHEISTQLPEEMGHIAIDCLYNEIETFFNE